MRILHVTDHYPPVLGGIETHVAALAARQAARGDDVTVLTSTPAAADGRAARRPGAGRGASGPGRLGRGARVDLRRRRRARPRLRRRAVHRAAGRRGRRAGACRRSSPCTRCGTASVPLPTLGGRPRRARAAPRSLWTAVSRVAAGGARPPAAGGHPRSCVLPNAVDVGPRAATPERAAAPRSGWSARCGSPAASARCRCCRCSTSSGARRPTPGAPHPGRRRAPAPPGRAAGSRGRRSPTWSPLTGRREPAEVRGAARRVRRLRGPGAARVVRPGRAGGPLRRAAGGRPGGQRAERVRHRRASRAGWPAPTPSWSTALRDLVEDRRAAPATCPSTTGTPRPRSPGRTRWPRTDAAYARAGAPASAVRRIGARDGMSTPCWRSTPTPTTRRC